MDRNKIIRNYILVSLCILNSVPHAYWMPGKRKEPMDTSSDVMKKRAEYENRHRSMFTTAAEYVIWPDLTTERRIWICRKYIGKLFKRSAKSVISTYTPIIPFLYQGITNENDHTRYTTLVAAIKCEISPPANGRKFIFFTRSPKDKCLYLMNASSPTSDEYYVVEEICEEGEYSFWEIFPSKKYENNRKYQKVLKEMHDNPRKLAEYEKNHLKDFLLHKDQYVKWPAFRKRNAEALCWTLLNKLFPRTIISVMNAEDIVVNIHYKTIEVIEDITVSALKCYLPGKQSNWYKFVKAPGAYCAYLIKQKRYGGRPMFFIVRLIYENDVLSKADNEANQWCIYDNYKKTSPDNWRRRIEYGECHKCMFATAVEYGTWPDLTTKNQIYLCKKYVDKLFNRNKRTVLATLSTYLRINYPGTHEKNDQLCERTLVATLRCEISPSADGCKFIFFIRSPKKDCLYLVKSRGPSSKEFFIIEEICESGIYMYWHICKSNNSIRAKKKYADQQKRRKDVNANKQEVFETNHLKHYSLHKDEHVKWLKFRGDSAEQLCMKLLRNVMPRGNYSILNATNEVVVLRYTKIQTGDKIVPNVIVNALKCHIFKKKRDNCFRFIKAPMPNCVHLIKHGREKASTFHISVLLCDDNYSLQGGGQVYVENTERLDKMGFEHYEIKKEPQYKDEIKIESDDYRRKYPSMINKTMYNFI